MHKRMTTTSAEPGEWWYGREHLNVHENCSGNGSDLLNNTYFLEGLQHSVLFSAETWGLPLSETIMPQYYKEMGYDAHMVGKVPVM